jgi:glycerophosphoryl diester phosphodiesterase
VIDKVPPIVIAHRGAPGYLPEHTLPSKALAYALGADYLEQDVVASRDDELVVLHDIYLDRVTDVAELFPERARADGRFYVRDFDLAELRELRVWERFQEDGSAVYPGRYPIFSGRFHLHTLAEELSFLDGLNRSSGRKVGCYPEIKRPAWHRDEGIDITPRILGVLEDFGYATAEDAAFLQCFDADELRRIREQLGCDLRLVQLIGENSWGEGPTDFSQLLNADGLAELSKTVDAIGPWINQLYRVEGGRVVATAVTSDAHEVGLKVHPYTFRKDELPQGFDTFEALINFFVEQLGIDGLFTDFTDLARRGVQRVY